MIVLRINRAIPLASSTVPLRADGATFRSVIPGAPKGGPSQGGLRAPRVTDRGNECCSSDPERLARTAVEGTYHPRHCQHARTTPHLHDAARRIAAIADTNGTSIDHLGAQLGRCSLVKAHTIP